MMANCLIAHCRRHLLLLLNGSRLSRSFAFSSIFCETQTPQVLLRHWLLLKWLLAAHLIYVSGVFYERLMADIDLLITLNRKFISANKD